MNSSFHLAFLVSNLEQAREFYGNLLQCPEGRSRENFVDFDFFGHQIVAHLVEPNLLPSSAHSKFDGRTVPVPHFGAVLEPSDWEALLQRIQSQAYPIAHGPFERLRDLPGEHRSFFLLDPFRNALEFKTFRNRSELFKKDIPS